VGAAGAGVGCTGGLTIGVGVGISGARTYDLRHAFASLLIHEGRMSIVEIAEQLGHNPTMCLDTYGHVMRELAGGERVSAEEQIVLARDALGQLSLM
jgi:integrase